MVSGVFGAPRRVCTTLERVSDAMEGRRKHLWNTQNEITLENLKTRPGRETAITTFSHVFSPTLFARRCSRGSYICSCTLPLFSILQIEPATVDIKKWYVPITVNKLQH